VSSAFAIAGVTAVLRDLLNNGVSDLKGVLGNDVTVSALPPDRLLPTSGVEQTQLNLFLYQVTPNSGWRNEQLPSGDSSGRNRLSNPPLALNLHYLLSAYGAKELHAEILLGYGMQLMHDTPILNRNEIIKALNPSPLVVSTTSPPTSSSVLPPFLQALADCGLADQFEQIKITPEYLSSEELSKLWTAVQSHYRPTAAYLVTVVLIQSRLPARAPLPVLSRGPVDPATGRDRGVAVEPNLLSPFPTIQSVLPTTMQPAATVGDTVDIVGHHLDGTNRDIVLSNTRFLPIEDKVSVASGGSSTTMQFVVPDLPVGFYQLAVRVVRPGESEPRTSNQLALVIGPAITTSFAAPISVARDGAGAATITFDCKPQINSGQQVSLLLGTREVLVQPFTGASGRLTFVVEEAPAGDHLVRLRVDGIESPLINYTATPPVFFNYRITIT